MYNNLSVNTLFCFSKRAIKYRKQLIKYIKPSTFTKRSAQPLIFYKFYIISLVLYNQWLSNKFLLQTLFLKSFYKRKNTINAVKEKTYFSKQVYLWYKLNNIFHTNLSASLLKYPNTGMLSSHFVHFLAKKNVTYQTRSKYRAKIFNMNSIYYYVYVYSTILYSYLQLVDLKLYFFTSNISKQHTITDEHFNTSVSN